MSSIPKDIVSRAHSIGFTFAYSEFVSMINPKNQGPNWDWNNYVDTVVRLTDKSCWQAFSDSEWLKWGKQIKEISTSNAKMHAEQIIKTSGVLDCSENTEEK